MRPSRTVRLAVGCALAVSSVAFVSVSRPARADWLVTRDGAQIETKGPWRVEGRQVLFHRTGGALASLRTDDVDLEASRTLTAEKKAAAEAKPAEAPPAAPAKRPASAARVTNPEVKGGGARGPKAPEGTAGEPAGEAAIPVIEVDAPFSIHGVALAETKDGWSVSGTLRLTGGSDVVKVVVAHLLVLEGEAELDSTPVEMGGLRFSPGAGTTFRGTLSRDPRGHRLRLDVDVEESEG